MATPSNLTHVAFAAPLDESIAAEILDPLSGFPVLQNVRQSRRGGLSKRLGYGTPLPVTRLGASSRTSGRRLMGYGSRTMVIDADGFVDVLTDSTGTNIPAGRAPETTATADTLAAHGEDLYDVTICNGFVVTVTRSTNSAGVREVRSTLQTEDGAILHADVILGDAGGSADDIIATLGTYGTTVLVFLAVSNLNGIATKALNCTSIATASAGWATGVTIASDKSTAGSGLAISSTQSFSSSVAIAYTNNASTGTNRVTVKLVNAAGVLTSATVSVSTVPPSDLGLEGKETDTLWLVWNDSSNIKVCGLNPSTLVVTGTALIVGTNGSGQLYAVSGNTATSVAVLFEDDSDVLTITPCIISTGAVIIDLSGHDGASHVGNILGAHILARPFRRGAYLYGLFTDQVQDRFILAEWTSFSFLRPVGVAFPGLSVATVHLQSHALTTSTTVAYPALVRRSQAGLEVNLVTFDFADPNNWRSADHNGVKALSGAVASYFDGRRVAEIGFVCTPGQPTATDTGSGSGPTGAYNYVATWEEIDSSGSWCLSGVSLPASTTGTGHAIHVQLPPLAISARLSSNKDPRIRVTLYRTTAGGAEPYFYVADLPNDCSGASGALLYTDSASDTAIAQNRTLYGSGNLPGTDGAALQRDAPPYITDVVSYAGMLVVATGSDIWWSGQTVPGEGTWFSTESFFLTVDGAGNNTAIAVLDGTLYIFKERSIYATSGEPPTDNGSSGGLSQPLLIASDVGCINPASVVVTSLGIFFQSHRGIELLAGGARPAWVGEKVRATLVTYPITTSAVIDERNSLVRFSLATAIDSTGAVSGDGRDLVFSLLVNDWQSVDDKAGTAAHEASQDAAVVTVGGVSRYAWIGATGIVRAESLSTDAVAYSDSGQWITMSAATGWFKVAGIQGRQQMNQLLVMARSRSDAGLSVSIGYNYADEYADPQTWTPDQIASILAAGWPITQLRQDPNDEAKGQSVRVLLEDTVPPGDGWSGTGEGLTWLALTLDITPESGPADVPQEAA